MKTMQIEENPTFIGRRYELERLRETGDCAEASILVVYGRRRVGKTELLEQAYRERNVLKFEGFEGQGQAEQIQAVLWQLAEYANDPLVRKLSLATWAEVFQVIGKYVSTGTWTLYLEELQWLANYDHKLIAELKFVWDNQLRRNRNLLLVLCGSSPSFMINSVLHSKALYNRSQHELRLRPFSLQETRSFLGGQRSVQEVMDAYLSVG